MISHETGEELTRVLRLRKFRLTAGEYHEALAAYLPYCEIVEVSRKCSVACRDAKDQMFLDLAHSGKADALVSGDRDLLVLAGRTKFLIESPEEYGAESDGTKVRAVWALTFLLLRRGLPG